MKNSVKYVAIVCDHSNDRDDDVHELREFFKLHAEQLSNKSILQYRQ